MYQRTQKRQCILCMKPLYAKASLYHVLYKPLLCATCLQRFEILHASGTLFSYPTIILFQYNDFFKQMLYQYKGLYDLALKDVFLEVFKTEFTKKYHKHLVVIAPSSESDNEKRGFVPNEEIVKTFSKRIFTGLYKGSDYKQTKQRDRSKVKEVIAIQNGECIQGQRILLFDDVITSGNTLLACIDILLLFHPKSIEVLVLASNQISTIYRK